MSRKLKLNVFGDSYSTPEYCVPAAESFWGLAAQELKVDQVHNYSHPGFSIDHIIHIILNEDFDFKNDYFLIGIPPLIRFVAYNDNTKAQWHKTCYNVETFSNATNDTVESLSNTLPMKFSEQFKNDIEFISMFSREWNDVQSLEKLYLLHQYLITNNAKFMIINLSDPIHFQDMWPAGKNIMIKVSQLTEIVMFDNTYYSVNHIDKIKPKDFAQYGWQGHHGPEGNKNWFDKVIEPKMKELGWIHA